MLTLLALLPGLYASASGSTSDLIYDLDGDDWTVTNGTMASPVAATVPGDVYTDLMANNILGDPYYGWNSMDYQWVAFTNWTYTKTFDISASSNNSELLTMQVLQLVCDGLDTRAQVFINDQLIFINDNMFQRNIINLNNIGNKSILVSGSNTIRIEFMSKPDWALEEANSCNTSTAGQCPKSCPNNAQQASKFCDVNFIRTEPCSFSWDWGPAFAPVGIWKSIYLQAYNTAVVRNVLIYANASDANETLKASKLAKIEKMKKERKLFKTEMRKDRDSDEEEMIYEAMNDRTDYLKDYSQWNVEMLVFLDSGVTDAINVMNLNKDKIEQSKKKGRLGSQKSGKIYVNWVDLKVSTSMNVTFNSNELVNFTVTVPQLTGIEGWMPNGFGNQKLYNVDVYFVEDDVQDHGSSLNFGFREIELVQNPLPSGKSFYFRVNGVPVPVHGSNWIPADAFESRVNRTSLEKNFIALQDSHQNMIRNWGGGIYQHEFDEYGIMIWEDMMWACNTYWVLPSYLQSSAKEVIDNVRRMQYHPSIAIWAGNNENVCSAGTNAATYYSELYFGTILDNIAPLDNTRPMVVSSPSFGNETEEAPCGDSYSVYYGDLHSYLYSADCWNVSVYMRPRFMSEFGLQSWPSYATLKEYFPSSQQNWTSSMMTNRNHHPSGQFQIENLISMHYNTPDSDTDWKEWLSLTQMYQAYCYKVEVEFLRSIRYECGINDPGCTMGTMYWQTNDIWPGASWASMDYDGRYKIAQYYAQDFYDNTIVSGYYNSTHFIFSAIRDDVDSSLTNGKLEFYVFSFDTSEAISSWHLTLNIAAADATKIYAISRSEFLTKSGCSALTDCILKWRVYDSEDNQISENWMFLGSPKDTVAKNPGLQVLDVMQVNSREYQVTYSVSELAVFVMLETDVNGYFDKNGRLDETGIHTAVFYPRVDTSETKILDSITISSLYEAHGFANASYSNAQWKKM